MIYAIDNRSRAFSRPVRRAVCLRPYRLLSCALLLVIIAMLIGIDQTPTYEQERIEAEARYLEALHRNESLRRSLALCESDDWQTQEARDAYGYTYEGETVYRPVFREAQ